MVHTIDEMSLTKNETDRVHVHRADELSENKEPYDDALPHLCCRLRLFLLAGHALLLDRAEFEGDRLFILLFCEGCFWLCLSLNAILRRVQSPVLSEMLLPRLHLRVFNYVND